MTNTRSIAADATFMVLYIGFTAAMATLSLLLLSLLAMEVEFSSLQLAAAVLNLFGWILLPFAPRLYQRIVGHPFSWRANGALGGEI